MGTPVNDQPRAGEVTEEEGQGAYAIGHTVTFTKTVGESDVYLMAGISGDLGPNHVNQQYMSQTRYGERVAHGVLVVSFMSTCSTKLIEEAGNSPAVSYGYDGVRFIKPVFIGDTITTRYVVDERDDTKGEIRSKVTAVNQHDEVVAVATHILRKV